MFVAEPVAQMCVGSRRPDPASALPRKGKVAAGQSWPVWRGEKDGKRAGEGRSVMDCPREGGGISLGDLG